MAYDDNKPIYQVITRLIEAIDNCKKSGNTEWQARHAESLEALFVATSPSGSGIDNGTHFWLNHQKPNRLVFNVSFHHMDEYRGYDGWTDHEIVVTPSLTSEFTIRVSGRNRNEINDHLIETYDFWLRSSPASFGFSFDNQRGSIHHGRLVHTA